MRFWSIASEAMKNVGTRTSRPILSLSVFVVIVGGLAIFDIGAISGILAQARAFAASGATITTIDSPAQIDGLACERLTSVPDVRAAGSISNDVAVTFSAFPSTPVPAKRATPGFLRLLSIRADSSRTGAYLSRELASALGASVGDTVSLLDGSVDVEGIYDYPDDGRLPGLGYALISVVPASPSARFDSCWIDVPHPAAETTSLLWTAVDSAHTGSDPTLGQLNSTRGLTFDAQRLYRERSSRYFYLIAFPLGAVGGYVLKRLRRLELASALHSGVPAAALLVQGCIEDLLWLLPAFGIVAAACFSASRSELPEDAATVMLQGDLIALTATVGFQLGAAAAIALTRERHLFRYFRER